MPKNDYDESTLNDILESEKQMVLDAKDKYDPFFSHVLEVRNFLPIFKNNVGIKLYIFTIFFSQIEKYTTLALLSAVRLHHTQTGMNLRQLAESAWRAAYALWVEDTTKFYTYGSDGMLNHDTDILKKEKNKRLKTNYKEKSEKFVKIINHLNETLLHSNLIYAEQNMNMENIGKGIMTTQYFDYLDPYIVKHDLWFMAAICIDIFDLFYEMDKTYKCFDITAEDILKLKKLLNENLILKEDLYNNTRNKKTGVKS